MKGISSHISDLGIAEVVFFSEQSNSLKTVQLKALSKQITLLGNNPEVKVIILKSEGKIFCSGANFNELLAIDNEKDATTFFSGFASVINSMRCCPKFIITAVQGKAVGGGVGLIAASDYVITNEYAHIRLSELSISIGPFVIGPAVQRKIGISDYTTLTLNPKEWKNADWSKGHGLTHEVCQSTEHCYQRATEKAQELSSYSSEAMQILKQDFWIGTEHWDELLYKNAKNSGQLLLTKSCQRSLKEFLKTK